MARRGVIVWGPLLLGVLLVGLRPCGARADVFVPDPPDTKRVAVTYELDWGALNKLVVRQHVVAKGDTLRGLATKYLGDARAWPTIAEANPKHVSPPDIIRLGDTLEIPLRGAGYVGFWVTGLQRWGPGLRVTGRATPQDRPERFEHGRTLLLLPRADAAPVMATLAKGKQHTFEDNPATGHVVGFGYSTLVKSDDPVHSLLVRYRLKGIAPEGVDLETTVTRLDAAGRELPPLPESAPAPKPGAVPLPSSALPTPQLMSIVGDIPVDQPLVEKAANRWPVWVGLLVAIFGLGIVLTIVRKRVQGERSQDGD